MAAILPAICCNWTANSPNAISGVGQMSALALGLLLTLLS
jgi:hypothetical protein